MPVELYVHSDIAIVRTKPEGLPIAQGRHEHQSYEFLIPTGPMPLLGHAQRTVRPMVNRLLPINSQQPHGSTENCPRAQFTAVMLTRDIIEETAFAMWRRKDVVFLERFVAVWEELRAILAAFMEEAQRDQIGREFVLDALTLQIVVLLLRAVPHNLTATEQDLRSACPNVQRAVEFLRDNYAKDFSLAHVAKVANLSPYHFSRVFRREIGWTPYDYLLQIRLEKALTLLNKRQLSITEICYETGFSNMNHFAAVFKRKLGVTPSQYRKQLTN